MPVSKFVFNVKLPRETCYQFDYKDNSHSESVYLRAGKKAIVISFDGGYLTTHGGHNFEQYLPKLLHPYQVQELGATFFHMASLRTDFFQFRKKVVQNKIIFDYDSMEIDGEVLPLLNYYAIYKAKPFFDADDFEEEEEFTQSYITALAFFSNVEEDKLWVKGQGTITWLRTVDSDEMPDIDIEK